MPASPLCESYNSELLFEFPRLDNRQLGDPLPRRTSSKRLILLTRFNSPAWRMNSRLRRGRTGSCVDGPSAELNFMSRALGHSGWSGGLHGALLWRQLARLRAGPANDLETAVEVLNHRG